MTSDKMNVETTETELKYSRTFAAPRELVFECFRSCEHLHQWWGPRSWPMQECEIDFRVGGRWHYCLRGPNEGDASWGLAIYREIAAPERLVYQDNFSDAEGNTNSELPSTLVTYEFEAQGDQTVLHGKAEYPRAQDLQQVLEMGMVDGMTETLDRLEEYVTMKAGAES